MTIKEAAEISGITIDNLRYYERIGLIPEVPRTDASEDTEKLKYETATE
jgi:DNA-binding transcriptional MerR regulator